MPFREFVSDLVEVLQGVKNDVLNTALESGSDNPQETSGDINDIASVLSGQGGVADAMGATAAFYAKGLDVLEARAERIEAGLEGADERGREIARDTMEGLSVEGNLPDPALRALSDVCGPGVRCADDSTPEYLEAWQEGQEVLYETAKPSAFDEIGHQRIATAGGFKSEVSDTCEATWGFPSAQEARDSGALAPLVPGPDTTPEPDQTDASAPSGTSEDTTGIADPNTVMDVDQPLASADDEPDVTGDGDLTAQDEGREAWTEAEAGEDAALAASAAAVDEPTADNDPETYTNDTDMKALTEAYDWEAEQFEEGETLFDEPASETTMPTPEEPITIPDAEARDPDEPEV